MVPFLSYASFLVLFLHQTSASDTTFRKPVLGFNTYNAVSCYPSDAYARQQIDALSSQGYVDAGYTLFGIDCGWQGRNGTRNAQTGAIDYDPVAFPNGIEPVSKYATDRGMQWAMYSDAGVRACDPTVPSPVAGSLGHEDADAAQFASWNTSYVKYDNCYVDGPNADQNAPKDPRTDFESRFSVMTNALRKVGIQGQLTCQWGVPFQTTSGRLVGPVDWTKSIGTSFRLSDDISDAWSSVVRIMNQAIHIAASGETGPGFHMDGDLLEVGNKALSIAQQQTHFAYWAMIKSALIISTNVTSASADVKGLLQNKALLAINQDDLGEPVKLVQRWTDDRDLYSGSLSNGDLAVLAVNWQPNSRALTINLADLNVTSADIEDLLTGNKQASASSYTVTVDANAPIALRLSNVVRSGASPKNVQWVEAESGQVQGGANTQSCDGCSGGKKVGSVGGANGGSVTLSNIQVTSSTATLLFDYVNAQVGYLGSTNNERRATISVNDNTPVSVSFPLSGYDWNYDVSAGYRVELAGFNPQGANSIKISAVDGQYGPDIDRVGFFV